MSASVKLHRQWTTIYFILVAVIAMIVVSGCTTLNTQLRSGSGKPDRTEIGLDAGLTGNNVLDLAAPAAINLDGFEFVPTEIAPTFTEKPFWIVLGLVVLGWIVLAADIPDE